MAENGKRVTQDDATAARKLLDRYGEQQIADAIAKREADLAKAEAMIGELGGYPGLREWALQKHEDMKRRGIGGGMTNEQAVTYYLRGLKVSAADVYEAFGLTPAPSGAIL